MYLDPIVSNDLVLDMLRGELSLSLKLSVYWQDIRLITRCVILLMLMADADNYENDDDLLFTASSIQNVEIFSQK